MQNIDFVPAEHKRYWISQYSKMKIPLPPLEVQQQIVAELDGYQKIIAGARQIVDNWKPSFVVDPEWSKVKLSEVCDDLFAGGDVPKDNFSLEKNKKHSIPIYTNGINEKSLYGYTDVNRVKKDSVTVSARGTIGYAEVRQAPFYPAVRLIVATPDLHKININFLKYSINNLSVYRNGNTIPQLTIPMISQEEIALPPLEVQQQIVDAIEAERKHMESAIALIDLYTQKTTSTIAKLWSE
jgi:restriction endonuclease S subunit